VNAVNAQAYWGYGVGYQGQGWHGNGYGYGYYQAYGAGYEQGFSDAQAGLTYDCPGHAQYYCNGYGHGFNTYENNSQTQGTEVDVKGNGNYIGVNQEQSSGIGSSYPALRDDNNGNGNDDNSVQPGQANPSCKVICLTILK
jgi:hypothetical protein